MATEDVDPRFTDLDAWPFASAIEAMWEGQLAAVSAVRHALPAITLAAGVAAERLGEAGRLIYVGAGTSGRVAVQDGAELPPTFDWPSERLGFALAGGEKALITSVEGAEDDAGDGAGQIDRAQIGPEDVVIGVAASGTTPFTVAAIRRAREQGAVTIGIANNAGSPLLEAAGYPVLVETGSELIAGSTRMKAGTAQKVVLNLISSAIMLKRGRVYRGMMVNMRAANAKLRIRAQRMVVRLAGCDEARAAEALDAAGYDIKLAIFLVLGHDEARARHLLARHDGNLRLALQAAENGAET
ncbi:MAG: N-acetylmuramic acid 6-phosphate etherase [Proteobacteria bacterium]|nr:N-acetylmuramic acid 6-phosphate etherase [Pseudomonadota bacterium]